MGQFSIITSFTHQKLPKYWMTRWTLPTFLIHQLYCISLGLLALLSTSGAIAQATYDTAEQRLQSAIATPEFMLNHWIELPQAPTKLKSRLHKLSLREAILLALRYNPNIQNAELDRVVQRYQLRTAYNQFELQYALGGAASIQHSRFSQVGSATNHALIVSPEANFQTPLGTRFNLRIDNNANINTNYSPVLNFSLTQPLLRGLDPAVNQTSLRNAIDMDALNRLNLNQAVMNQITQVITNYRALILSSNNLENQQRQLTEARTSFKVNEQKIKSGQLAPTANVQQSYQIESLNLMVEQAQNDFQNSAQTLLQTIGLDPHMRLSVPQDVTVTHLTIPDLDATIATALSHNTQYLAQKMALAADERAYRVAKNQQLWQLDLSANVQSGALTSVDGVRGLRSIYNGHNINESAQLMLTIPINDVNRKGQLIQAKITLEKDRLNLQALKRALITEVTNAINTLKSQVKRYHLAQKQVNLATQSYELEKQKQQAGIATSLDVNNTQNQLLQAQANLIGVKVAYLNQLSALQRLIGTTLKAWHINLRYGQ
tara:strand:- start:799 stop:2436 length:1638 start_codon:yes stop_codon:yes gene_type:complete